jgi:maltooligosyltrehalose trehalohydrolase
MPQPVEFAVWAPLPRRVRLQVDGAVHDMRRDEHGWWRAEVPAGPEADYGYLLDENEDGEKGGRTPRPDPRSRRQPDGVHGLSRRFDPSRYTWGDEAWTGRQLAGGVVYELHVGTFTPEGTLDAAIGRLDHLLDLGVQFVELLPVNAFNGTHNWGYDGVLWYAVQETYGGPEAYQRFVDACHQRGLAVIQDVVYNHLGPSGNYLPEFFPIFDEGRPNPWGASVNLSGPESHGVRRYILDNVQMWFRDMHVDGLRLDAVHALLDDRAIHLLEEMTVEVESLSVALGRPLSLIAESDLNDARLVTDRAANGTGLTAQWSDDFHHALHATLTGESQGYYGDFADAGLGGLAKTLTEAFFHDGSWSSFRQRSHGRPVDTRTVPGWKFLGYLQDHDQVGNRATGDRISAGLSPGRLAVGATLLLTSPFTPMLFMGEEWGASTPWQFFTSHPEPELGRATAEGRKAEFAEHGWDGEDVPDPQEPETFSRSKLDWAEPDKEPHRWLLEVYRRLLRLRREHAELSDPWLYRVAVSWDDDDGWLVVHRGSLRVVANLADVPRAIELDRAVDRPLYATADEPHVDGATVTLRAESAAVVRVS